MEKSPAPLLSIILPFYRKLAELRAVLPYNARYLGRKDVELVLVLDEPSQEKQVLALLDQLPLVRARVVVNDRPHDWRPPCIAINVGLKAALGKYVLIASPESAFVGDAPSRIIEMLSRHPDDVLLGRVAWAALAAARKYRVEALFDASISQIGAIGFAGDYYGSIAAAKARFEAIGGYDESLSEWGGDDDNVRARLSMDGAMLMLDRSLSLLHLSKGQPNFYRHQPPKDAVDQRRLVNPALAKANEGREWGVEFGRVARDWRATTPIAASAATAAFPSPQCCRKS